VIESGEIISELQHNAVVTRLQFNPDGKLLGSAGMEGKLKVWDVDSGRT
jgi:WD40 repeat protein